MPPSKRGKLLIATSYGNLNNCGNCGSKDIHMVVHDQIEITNLKEHGEELAGTQKGALMQAFPKQCVERFLCKGCYEFNYKYNDILITDGVFNYTSLYPEDRAKRQFFTVKEAVERFS